MLKSHLRTRFHQCCERLFFLVSVAKREYDDANNERTETEAPLYVWFDLDSLKGGWMLRSCRNVQQIFVLISDGL